MVAALAITFFAAGMSTRLFDQAYEEKPATATWTPLTSTTVIWSGAPVCARPCSSRAFWVFSYPFGPKSLPWLLAWLSRSNPASARCAAYSGGARNWKQRVEFAPHLPVPVSTVNGSSRLPITRSAASAFLTESKKPLPLLGGSRLGAIAMTMSPVAESEIGLTAGALDSTGPPVAPPPAPGCQTGRAPESPQPANRRATRNAPTAARVRRRGREGRGAAAYIVGDATGRATRPRGPIGWENQPGSRSDHGTVSVPTASTAACTARASGAPQVERGPP